MNIRFWLCTGQCFCEIENNFTKMNLSGFDKSAEMIWHAKQKSSEIYFFEYNIDDGANSSHEYFVDESFDLVICTHSLPYYQKQAINALLTLVKKGGRAIFIQASVNKYLDKCIMSIVEKTAEKAHYLSIPEFKKLLPDNVEIEQEFIIRKKWFMPTIAGFVLWKI